MRAEVVAERPKSIVKEAVAYLAAITCAEIVTMFLHPLWGVVGHTIIMAMLIVRAARSSDRYHQQLALSLTILPLLRIIDLSLILSLIQVTPMLRFPIIYAPPLVGGFMVMRLLGYKRSEVGLTLGPLRSIPLQLGIASSGFLLGWLEDLILKPEPMVSEISWTVVLLALILVATTGFVEEFVFRGVLQRAAAESIGGWRGIIYVSVLFAVMHMGFQSWIDVLFVFAVAMFFAWVVKRTGSLLGVTLAHGITNIMLFLVIPFL